ncbi:MAG: 50S ribosomal protein L9 [Psychroflexus sp.]|jgi:large subunit ribosomal protein L9|nr:50S ribosomal protein L9 [Psychroflexus sp.]MDR9448368.1 50S ribosomal protein L9 [Psychroflexus sp.]
MEIILKKDVDKLGFTDDVVDVKNGYARNYLIPQGFAVLATPSAKKHLQENLKQRAFKEKQIIEQAQKQADKIDQLEDFKLTAKAGKDDKLFGSVTNANLSEELEKHGIELDKKYISIQGGNIKRLGQYDAQLRFHREVIKNITFDVLEES